MAERFLYVVRKKIQVLTSRQTDKPDGLSQFYLNLNKKFNSSKEVFTLTLPFRIESNHYTSYRIKITIYFIMSIRMA